MGTKKKRIESLLAQEIPMIVQQELNDPRLGFITITEVEIAKDFKHAKVFFSALGADGKDEPEERILMFEEVLNSCAGEVQRSISRRLELRFIPVLRFIYTDSLRKSVEISELIRKARATDLDNVNPDNSDDG